MTIIMKKGEVHEMNAGLQSGVKAGWIRDEDLDNYF